MVSGLVVILLSAQNVRWVHHRCSAVPRQLSLLSCKDVFVCETNLGHNCKVEKFKFKRGEDSLGEVEKFCYMDMISFYGAVSARIGSVWKRYRELSGVLVGKEDLVLKQRGKIYRYCVRPVMLYFVKQGNLLLMSQGCMGCSVV